MWINYLQQKWWHRRNNNAWHFWINPYSEVRVTPLGHSEINAYYYSRPTEQAAKVLQDSEWECVQGSDCYRTEDKDKAEKALSQLGLEVPVPKENHCYRVYWQDNMYYI